MPEVVSEEYFPLGTTEEEGGTEGIPQELAPAVERSRRTEHATCCRAASISGAILLVLR